jgi:hypothetical protein
MFMQKTVWSEATFTVKRTGTEPAIANVRVGVCRASESRIEVGPTDSAPLMDPALRWAADLCKARRARVVVETQTKLHTGAFAGTYARLLLRNLTEQVV